MMISFNHIFWNEEKTDIDDNEKPMKAAPRVDPTLRPANLKIMSASEGEELSMVTSGCL